MEAISSPHSSLRYRPDIDGLRAVAVLLVVFCHLGVKRFDGGYIGVDVFFVISGYLISGILLRELAAGTFTFAAFYERRVRRIAPALLATLLVTLYLAQHYYFAAGLYDVACSMAAALLSGSNFFFMHSSKYFDPVNQSRPLLHTWSLAVEEQYYLVFPVLLVAIYRWGARARRQILWALAALSFAAILVQMHYAYGQYPVSFFFSPLRAWEFLIGTILYDLPKARAAWQRNTMSATGLLCILIPAHFYSPVTVFPGLAALPPCLGAALFIAAGEAGESAAGRVLSWRPVRFVGLISYSLYLVHWPILLFQRDSEFLVDAERHPRWVIPVVLGVSLLTATLLWRFIEMPFRQGRLRPSRGQLYGLLGPVAGVLLVVCGLLIHNNGWGIANVGFTYKPQFDRWKAFHLREGEYRAGGCYAKTGLAAYDVSACLAEDPRRQNWLLFGDSHSAMLYEGLQKAYPGVNISQASMPGCWPVAAQSNWVSADCNRINALALQDFTLHHHLDAVVLSARWGWWMKDGLADTLALLKDHGVKVFIVGPSPEFTADVTRLVVLAERHHNAAVYSTHLSAVAREQDDIMAWLTRNEWHVPYISMFADLCTHDPDIHDPPWQVRTTAGCPVFATAQVPLLADDNHLTPEGALVLANTIKAHHELP